MNLLPFNLSSTFPVSIPISSCVIFDIGVVLEIAYSVAANSLP